MNSPSPDEDLKKYGLFGLSILQFMAVMALLGIAITCFVQYYFK